MKYLYNDPADLGTYHGIFGKSWETAAELDPSIGAFLLLDNEKRAVVDENAARCFAVQNGCPDHSAISEMLMVTKGFASDIETKLIPCGEGLTAGFVHTKDLAGLQELHCGLSQQRDLISAAAKDLKCAVLLLSVNGAQGSREMLDSCWFTAADAVLKALPENALMARVSENEFRVVLPSSAGSPEETAERLCGAVRSADLITRHGTFIGGEHPLSLSVGICAEEAPPAYKFHSSAFALYEADADPGTAVKVFRPESYEKSKEEYYRLVKFSQLIKNNLFIYHFQPIVNAHNGDIFAYEALMRSDPSIGYGPLEILSIGEKLSRLYEIELATIRNTLTALSGNQRVFDKRKLFINSIPSQLLTEEDFGAIVSDFGELLEKIVIEFTEHTEVSSSSLECMKSRLKRSGMGLAIDDYGTGYSNTSNLMRYSPDFVKIDRSLIADIDQKPKMQSLVAGIIDFVHSTGGLALAEGVETLEEVRTMINLSVDLLQGYYVSRPKPVLLDEISDTVRGEIIKINLETQGSIRKVFRASDGDCLELNSLSLEGYTDIFIEGGSVTLTGQKDMFVRMPLTVREDAECELILQNVYIEPEKDINTLTLSRGSKVRLVCEGESVFSKGAVIVPEEAHLRISGLGSLSVLADNQNCCAVGSPHDMGCGSIEIDMDGTLAVSVNGMNGIGIGGGRNASVTISGGVIDVSVASYYGVGIGSHEGTARVYMHDCAVRIVANSTESVCVGSLTGKAEIKAHNIAFSCVCTGNTLCVIGALGSETAAIEMHDLHISTDLRGRQLVNIGTSGSSTVCSINRCLLELYSEGSSVSGIGDKSGGGKIYIENSELTMTFLTGSCHLIGSPNGTHELVGVIKNIHLNE